MSRRRGRAGGLGGLVAAIAAAGLVAVPGAASASTAASTATQTAPVPAPADEVLVDEDFASGQIPSGWTTVLGDWKVVDGRLQATTAGARARIGFGPAAPDDFRVEATVRFVQVSEPSRWLNIGADYHAAEDYGAVLVARSRTTANNGLELAQAAKGGSYASAPVGPAPVDLGTGADHRLALEAHGSSFVVTVDGDVALRGTNLRRTGGAFGFVINNATVQFDDVRVTRLPAAATPPTAPQNLRLVEDGSSAAVAWEPPADPGATSDGTKAGITGYEVAIAPTSVAESAVTWQPVSATSYVFENVPDDAEQTIRVRAVSSADVRGPSATVRTKRGGATLDGLKLAVDGGAWPSGHVQGIAVDARKGFIYYSFTNLLVKTDLAGNVVGTVEGFTGHLGDLDLSPSDGRVYGSLEYKAAPAFYIAIFDVDKIDRIGMNAQQSDIVSTVYLPEVVDDFTADLDGDGRFDGDTANTADHRYGCSGIDGVAFGPAFGKTGGQDYLTVAYGIYANTSREDNDHQVLLQYDTSAWAQYERPLVEKAPHHEGPAQTDGKYFAFTGNTTYGVQNLEYDPWLERWFLGVYTGTKPAYPNYGLFAIDAASAPERATLRGLGEQGMLLPLAEDGLEDAATGIRGWRQKADVGIQSVGHGLFYLAKNGTQGGQQTAALTLERWTGDAQDPFAPATPDYRVVPQIVSAPPGEAVVGRPYAHTFVARSYPDARLRAEGTLPPGLTFDPAQGTLSGTPTRAGSYSFTVVASNGTESARQQATVTVRPAVWASQTVYVAGDEVTYDGGTWRAGWWTRGQVPGDPYGPWQEIVTVADGTASWTPSRIFVAGEIVEYGGERYAAKWWTRNQRPGDRWGPWEPVD